jgi:response regulator RpfG family c-di-GMP phosphodiesterase
VPNSTDNHGRLETKKKTVMICDDEPDVLLSFEGTLRSIYDIIMVDSGEKCIEKYIEEKNRGNEIHLILLDYRLGSSMFGDSVARKIKEYNGTKIILISAYDLDGALLKELEDGNYIAKYVEKPIHTNRLVELVAEITS